MPQGIPLHSHNNKAIPLIIICHLAIGTIDYILTICKVINNNKTVNNDTVAGKGEVFY